MQRNTHASSVTWLSHSIYRYNDYSEYVVIMQPPKTSLKYVHRHTKTHMYTLMHIGPGANKVFNFSQHLELATFSLRATSYL